LNVKSQLGKSLKEEKWGGGGRGKGMGLCCTDILLYLYDYVFANTHVHSNNIIGAATYINSSHWATRRRPALVSLPDHSLAYGNDAITHQDTEIPEEGICCNANSQEQIKHCRFHSEGIEITDEAQRQYHIEMTSKQTG